MNHLKAIELLHEADDKLRQFIRMVGPLKGWRPRHACQHIVDAELLIDDAISNIQSMPKTRKAKKK